MSNSASITSYSTVPRQSESYSSASVTATDTTDASKIAVFNPRVEEAAEHGTGTGVEEVQSRELRDLFSTSNKQESQKLIEASPVRVSRYGEVEGRTPAEEKDRPSETKGQTDDPTEKFNNAEIFKATAFIVANVGTYRG